MRLLRLDKGDRVFVDGEWLTLVVCLVNFGGVAARWMVRLESGEIVARELNARTTFESELEYLYGLAGVPE